MVLAFFSLNFLTVEFKGDHGENPLWLSDLNGVKFTAIVADAAFDAFVLNDGVRLFLLPETASWGHFLKHTWQPVQASASIS
jgi:hypothetical protein